MSRPILFLFTGYKRWISPLLGPRCRFEPSCADYARVAVARFGALAGGWTALTRVVRCQPLCRGGLDPVPEHFRWWPAHGDQPQPGHDHD